MSHFTQFNQDEEKSARGDMSSWLGFKSYRDWSESLAREEHPTEDDFRAYDEGKKIPPLRLALRLETDEDVAFDRACRVIREHAAHCEKCRETLRVLRGD
jgi:hypothetical protein